MNKITKLSCCRICNSKNLKKILHLKDMPLTDEFVKKKDIGKEFLHDINIYICEDCFVVQTQHDVDVDRYYLDYQYSVAHSQKANKFMKKLAKNIKNKYFNKSSNKSVLEIGRILIAQGKRNEAIKRFQDVLNIYGKEKAALVARQYIQEIRSN